MDLSQFETSLDEAAPPAGVSAALAALWQAAKGDWHAAHGLAQSQDDSDGAWVHAYLHRVEGDEGNAGYWYRRAGRPHCMAPLPEEWREIATALL